jgi:hypothetical protein
MQRCIKVSDADRWFANPLFLLCLPNSVVAHVFLLPASVPAAFPGTLPETFLLAERAGPPILLLGFLVLLAFFFPCPL